MYQYAKELIPEFTLSSGSNQLDRVVQNLKFWAVSSILGLTPLNS